MADPAGRRDLERATRALAQGDPLAALRVVALREDPLALSLRGVAMAQLGDLARARELLRRAARAWGPRQPLSRARCVVALAEVALAARDLARPPSGLAEAIATLEARGDRVNALHAHLNRARRLVLVGRGAEAARMLESLELRGAPSVQRALAALIEAELARRSGRANDAVRALARARSHAERAHVPALAGEIHAAERELERPIARAIEAGHALPLTATELERRLRAHRAVVDVRQRRVQIRGRTIDLRRRPVLFGLLRALAEGAPETVAREHLARAGFGSGRLSESLRVRLRVELARLRRLLAGLAMIAAHPGGFRLHVPGTTTVLVVAPLVESDSAALLGLLADGSAWSSSALAMALGSSQRSVQRALAELERQGEVRSSGRARARRWSRRSLAEIATPLLLPVAGEPE